MATGYVYPGRVVAIDPGGPIVVVPLLAQSARWGPLPSAVPDLTVGEQVIVTSLGTSRDQLVILGRLPGRAPTIEEIPDLPEQLNAVNTRIDAVEIDNDTDRAMLTDHETRIAAATAKNTTQDTRLTGVEGRATSLETRATSLEGRATTVEGRASALETRATSIEGVNTTQDGRLTAVESKNTTQDTRLTATETVANAAATGAALTTLRGDTAGKVTTKGDLLAGTAAGVLARQAAGADGLALVADSTQATGLTYAERRGVPRGLTGATAPTRYVGATAAGPPTGANPFVVGDYVIDGNGVTWWCSVAGSPGTWINSALTKPLAHAGSTDSFQGNNAGAYTVFSTAQVLRGGITFDNANDALVVPRGGLYRVSAKAYFTGGTAYQGQVFVVKNSAVNPPPNANTILGSFTWKPDASDYQTFVSDLVVLAANDVIRHWTKGSSSTWGTDGYNGSYLELEFMDQ